MSKKTFTIIEEIKSERPFLAEYLGNQSIIDNLSSGRFDKNAAIAEAVCMWKADRAQFYPKN
jgi:hypothetical protein